MLTMETKSQSTMANPTSNGKNPPDTGNGMKEQFAFVLWSNLNLSFSRKNLVFIEMLRFLASSPYLSITALQDLEQISFSADYLF